MKSNTASVQNTVTTGLVIVVVMIVVGAYLINLDGWLMHDDEGTDFYEAYRLAQGDRPGTDFMAEQQPLYLITGGALVKTFGLSALPLRSLAATQVLLGIFFLSYASDRVFGRRAGLLTLLLVATSGMVYSLARLYRPDPMMLSWIMIGLGAALLASAGFDRRWWLASGLAFGVAFLWKPFAVFPVFGLGLYFASEWFRSAGHRRDAVIDALRFGLPLGFISILLNGVLHLGLDLYYLENLRQHAALGRDLNLLLNFLRPPVAYVEFFLAHPAFLFVIPLWWLNRPADWRQRPEVRLLLWQMVAPILFVALTRPFYPRYMIFLAPVFAVLLAWQLDLMFRKLSQSPKGELAAVVMSGLIVLFALVLTSPRITDLLLRRESGTKALAAYVAEHSGPDEVILSDYAGINFFADRRSIYEASIIAAGRIQGGFVTGELLIERMEEDDVKLVLVHVKGGDPIPHQFVRLSDYDDFRAYLGANFELLTLFDRNGQQIEVYSRSS
ncbi:MAG: glycosyltransferase family 39 protein [Chloroflexota bacterium]|nr:MAG: glycosyltransferase family 39 protein [Chloroflexota bacterium]